MKNFFWQANKWCAIGFDLLASSNENAPVSAEMAEKNLRKIQEFIASAAEFQLSSSSQKEYRNSFLESTTLETKALVAQVSSAMKYSKFEVHQSAS